MQNTHSSYHSSFTNYAQLVSLGILTAGLLVLFLLPRELFIDDPTGSLCLSQNFFGIPCPGCGMVRATYALLHLDVAYALKANFAVLGLLPFLAALSAYALLGNTFLKRLKNVTFYIFIGLLIAQYIVTIFTTT